MRLKAIKDITLRSKQHGNNTPRHNTVFIAFISSFILLSMIFPPSLTAKDTVVVRAVSYSSLSGSSRVVVDLSGPAEFTQKRLSNPERLCIDLKASVLGRQVKKSLSVNDGILKSVRAGQFTPDTVRIVIDFEGKEKADRFNISLLDSPERLVIEADGAQLLRIVIDAGHGGHDPGAVGRKGLKEKDITLAIAKKLKKLLEKNPRYKVFLTRDKDIFLDLGERTEIANRKTADLFISIHANASPKRQARGIETYLLNWTDDEEAMRVAARENATARRKMKQSGSDIGIILASLQLQNKRDESLKLANYIQGSIISGLNEQYPYPADLGVKQAFFYVLFGAKMPSVLVEVSFITNPQEEKLLKKDKYQDSLAGGIAGGIEKFIASTYIQDIAAKE